MDSPEETALFKAILDFGVGLDTVLLSLAVGTDREGRRFRATEAAR